MPNAAGLGALAAGVIPPTGELALDTAINAIVGGIGAVLGGGKFWSGAVTAAFGYVYNKLAEKLYTPEEARSKAVDALNRKSSELRRAADDLDKGRKVSDTLAGEFTYYFGLDPAAGNVRRVADILSRAANELAAASIVRGICDGYDDAFACVTGPGTIKLP